MMKSDQMSIPIEDFFSAGKALLDCVPKKKSGPPSSLRSRCSSSVWSQPAFAEA